MTMTRRVFMAGSLAAWLPAAAEPSRKYRIGYLTPRAVRLLVDDYLKQALSDAGYVNGVNAEDSDATDSLFLKASCRCPAPAITRSKDSSPRIRSRSGSRQRNG